MTIGHFKGDPDELSIQSLKLDPSNPRLPQSLVGANQKELVPYIARNYNAIEVARSIAVHGYFPSEPLIVIKEDDSYVVVEGNRRLAALTILTDPDKAKGFEDAIEWAELAEQAELPARIPVIVASDRQSVIPVIGYRHISGIEPWDPYAKARFIASLVDDEMLDFRQVADLVGERPMDVAAHYRNLAVVRQASGSFEIDTTRVTNRFGVLTRAMTSVPLRAHISAPAPVNMSPVPDPLADNMSQNVRELFSWVFGDDNHDPVIGESRDISRLGQVVSSDEGLKVLRQTRNLELAHESAGGLYQRFKRRLVRARAYMDAAREDIATYRALDEIKHLIAECQESLRRLMDSDDKN